MIVNLPGTMLLICYITLNVSGNLFDFFFEKQNIKPDLSLKVIVMQILVFLPITLFICLIKKQGFFDAVLVKKVKTRFFPFIITISLWLPVAFTLLNVILISKSTQSAAGSFFDHPELSLAAVCFVPAILEEFFFRGVLFRLLCRGGSSFAVISSALFFAMFHNDIHNFLWPFFAGLVYGFMVITFRSVWPSVFAHMVNNLFSYYANDLIMNFKQDTELLILLILFTVIFLVLTFIGLSHYQNILTDENISDMDGQFDKSMQKKYALTTLFSLPVLAVAAIFIHTAVLHLIYFNGGAF